MAQNTEIEAKIILPQAIYQKLLADFPTKSSFSQANYYFDTDDGVLKRARTSCRIRIFSSNAEQTLKVPNPSPIQQNFHEAIEINDALPHKRAQELVEGSQKQVDFSFHGNVGSYLKKHFPPTIQLHLQTYSKTQRTLVTGPKSCELTLDKSTYPDGYADYELEIENSQPDLIKKVLAQLKEDYHFTSNASTKNQAKIARAFTHRAKM